MNSIPASRLALASIFVTLFLGCIAISGSDTVSRRDFQDKLGNLVLIKGSSCSIEPDTILLANSLVDPDYGTVLFGSFLESRRKTILYERKASETCYQAIALVPCPPANADSLAPGYSTREEQWLASLYFNLVLGCDLDEIWFWDFKVPFEGTVF
jgi:hypothetical protein